ncbi:MAG: hypothetical protein M3Y56_07240, partial [Armatimonadota bacterium]|nr:hypothetical protein [Armatimonadota bacterium]
MEPQQPQTPVLSAEKPPARSSSVRAEGAERRSPQSTFLIHVLLILGSITFLLPLAWMMVTSVKPIQETMTVPPTWIPSSWHWHNYYD